MGLVVILSQPLFSVPTNNCRDIENCKTRRSVRSILDLPQASQPLLMKKWREKDVGAQPPSLCPGQQLPSDRENCKTLRSVHSILSLPQASQLLGRTSRSVALPLKFHAGKGDCGSPSDFSSPVGGPLAHLHSGRDDRSWGWLLGLVYGGVSPQSLVYARPERGVVAGGLGRGGFRSRLRKARPVARKQAAKMAVRADCSRL